MTLTFATGVCVTLLTMAAIASCVGSALRFTGRFDGPADDHEQQSVNIGKSSQR